MKGLAQDATEQGISFHYFTFKFTLLVHKAKDFAFPDTNENSAIPETPAVWFPAACLSDSSESTTTSFPIVFMHETYGHGHVVV